MKKILQHALHATWLVLIPGHFGGLALAQETDRVNNLIMEPGWQLVQTNCTSCHSSLLIVQNSGTREVWKSRIVWMQETQGLPQLGTEVEATILDYLASNYGPKEATRRAALASHLMPANPYSD